MPHSLRCRLKGLCYKKILTDRECERLIKALDVVDAIENIKNEIWVSHKDNYTKSEIVNLIDRHISGKE